MLIIQYILFSIPIAIIAVVYACVLTAPHMILERVDILAGKFLPEWLYFPLIGCEKCVSGQLAMWCYYPFILGRIGGKYDVFMYIFFICQSIFSTIII